MINNFIKQKNAKEQIVSKFIAFIVIVLSVFVLSKINTDAESIKVDIAQNVLNNLPQEDSEKKVRNEYFAQKSNGQKNVTVVGYLGADTNSATSDTIADIKIYFHITNPTKQKLPLLRVPTGIKQDMLNYIRVEGATGYEWVNGQLDLAYVSLQPGASVDVTVTALPLISPDQISIDISPKVKNKNGPVITTGEILNKIIKGKRKDVLDRLKLTNVKSVDNNLKVDKVENSTNSTGSE